MRSKKLNVALLLGFYLCLFLLPFLVLIQPDLSDIEKEHFEHQKVLIIKRSEALAKQVSEQNVWTLCLVCSWLVLQAELLEIVQFANRPSKEHAFVHSLSQDKLLVSFSAYGKQFLALLERDTEVVPAQVQGQKIQLQSSFYQGELLDPTTREPVDESHVIGYKDEHAFVGFILDGNSSYNLERSVHPTTGQLEQHSQFTRTIVYQHAFIEQNLNPILEPSFYFRSKRSQPQTWWKFREQDISLGHHPLACEILVTADFYFYQNYGQDINRVTNQAKLIIELSSIAFALQDFTRDGVPDGIQLKFDRIIVHTTAEETRDLLKVNESDPLNNRKLSITI